MPTSVPRNFCLQAFPKFCKSKKLQMGNISTLARLTRSNSMKPTVNDQNPHRAQGRASRIILKGVSAAFLTLLKPPSVITEDSFFMPA
jgi:hypothetical protein